jgi:MFS family permease
VANSTEPGTAPQTGQVAEKTWAVGTLIYTRPGLAWLFSWLIWGDLAWAMRDRITPPIMQILFKAHGASDTLEGILFGSIPACTYLIAGPIVGYISDRHRGPRGRRIPFLLGSTPIIFLSILALAACAATSKPGSLFYGLAVMTLFWTLFEVACYTANALYGALVNDVVPHPLIGRFYGIFRIASLVVGAVFYNYFGLLKGHHAEVLIGLGLIYGVGFTIMCLNVREGSYPPPHLAESRAPARRLQEGLQTFFQEGFGHSYYCWFYAAVILAGLSIVPVNLFSIFYAESVHLDQGAYGHCITWSYLISIVLAYPLGLLADRLHPLRLVIITLTAYFAIALWGAFYARTAWTFEAAFMLHTVLSGCYYTAAASLPQRLLPRGNYAQLFSALSALNSFMSIFFAPLVGRMLDHFHHNYRLTFWVASVVTAAAVLANLVLYRKFVARGGPKNYRPPIDPDSAGFTELP